MTAAARPLDLAPPSTTIEESTDLPDLVFVAVLGLLGIVGFRSVYGGWSWLTTGGAGLAAGIALGYVGRRRRLDALLLAVATVAVYFVLSGIAISQDAISQVVPTPGTVRGAADGAVWSWAELLTALPPVGRLGNLGVVPLMCGLLGGVLATSAALRTKGMLRPLVPLVGIVVLAILFGTDRPASVLLQGAVFAAVSIAWVAFRRRGTRMSASATAGTGRLVGGVLMVVLAGVIATVAGDHLPGLAGERFILRDRSDPPFDPKQQASPLASFAKYKSDRNDIGGARDRTLFTVTGLPDGVPLRLAVMDTYDGVVWKVAGGADGGAGGSGMFERVGEAVPTDADADLPKATDTARVQITVEDYNDIWMPDVGSVRSIQFGGPRSKALAEALRFNRATNVGAVPLRFVKGDRIVVDAAWSPIPVHGAAEHPYHGKAAGVADVGGVDRVAAGLPELAERILASGPDVSAIPPDPTATPDPAAPPPAAVAPGFDSVSRVAEEFVVSPGYGYSDGRPDDKGPSISGHSERRMSTFADESIKRGLTFGNDEQYASALALISRTLQVPSRVAMGFCLRGCPGGKVTGKDVSAWVEVNLAGVGWVPLDATPSPDKPQLSPVKPKPKPKPKNASQPPPPPVTVPPPEEVVADNVSPKKKKPDSDSILSNLPLGTIAAVGGPVLLIGGFVGGVLTLKKRRRRRRRETGSPLGRVVGGWDELEDRAYDLGCPLPTRATRREVATFLGTEAAWHSARIADASIFGPDEPSDTLVEDYWTSIDETYDGMAADESGLRRVRADLNPASLLRAARRNARFGLPGRRSPRGEAGTGDDGLGDRSVDGAADRDGAERESVDA